MDPDLVRSRLAEARIARLATVGPGGRPHVVPFCFALIGERLVSVVDLKPKRTEQLRRLANLRANPAVEVLIDHYEEDWRRLWWLRARGRATVLESGPDWEAARAGLAAKYHQYGSGQYLDSGGAGPVLSILPGRWQAWSGDGSESGSAGPR